MPNVVRFTLSTARNLDVSGAGSFVAGVLDVDANNVAHVARVRYLVQPYRAVEVGIVDSATPPPVLPAVPGTPNPDPYPQYPTLDEIAASTTLRAAFVAGRVLNNNGSVNTQKKVTVKLTADGLDIDDLIIEDVA